MSPRNRRKRGAKAHQTMSERVLGVLLAGGLAQRMGGGDKPLKLVAGISILDRVIGRMVMQCDGLILNANGDPNRFAFTGLPVIPDSLPDYQGPLAGILAGMDYAADHGFQDILTVSADSPFLPRDLALRLILERRGAKLKLACAKSGGFTHPPIGLWNVELRHDLRKALLDGERKIDRWTKRHGVAEVEWLNQPYDPFFNANSPDDLHKAEAILARHPDA
jgi:molybdenum cofactor guanylyltransferase